MNDTLRAVSIEELSKWIKKNRHVTWSADSFGNTDDRKAGHLRGKYIRFNLDTRTMTIFNLTLEGLGTRIHVDFRDSGKGSILDELDRRLTEDGK